MFPTIRPRPAYGFNEAAGFTRRKLGTQVRASSLHHHASMRPPDLPGGNHQDAHAHGHRDPDASMRPPDLPGGNSKPRASEILVMDSLQ